MYYALDDNIWIDQIDEPNFNQKRCMPPDSAVVMNRIYTSIKVPTEVALQCGCNFNHRKEWDNVLFDMRTFEQTEDFSYARIAYTFGSPWPANDRDFYLRQLIRRDFPEPGSISVYTESLPDSDEYPIQKKRVRGKL